MIVYEKANFLSVTANEKYWSFLDTFLIKIYMFLRICHFTSPVSKLQILNAWKHKLWKSFACNCYILYLLLNFWKILLPWSFFLYLKLSHHSSQMILLPQFYHDLFIYQQFAYLVLLEIRNTGVPLEIPYIYNIFKVCNNILFLIVARNAFLAPLLLIPDKTVFFIGT